MARARWPCARWPRSGPGTRRAGTSAAPPTRGSGSTSRAPAQKKSFRLPRSTCVAGTEADRFTELSLTDGSTCDVDTGRRRIIERSAFEARGRAIDAQLEAQPAAVVLQLELGRLLRTRIDLEAKRVPALLVAPARGRAEGDRRPC